MLLHIHDLIGPFYNCYEVGAIISPILQRRKLRLSNLPKITWGANDNNLNIYYMYSGVGRSWRHLAEMGHDQPKVERETSVAHVIGGERKQWF